MLSSARVLLGSITAAMLLLPSVAAAEMGGGGTRPLPLLAGPGWNGRTLH